MSYFGGTYEFGLPYVFISYSSVDRDIIEQFINILDKYKIDVWVDYAAIEYGKSIVECIEQGIQNASAILCIISNNSTKSNWCKVEYESALTKEIESGKTLIIPIVLGRPQIPFLLRHKKYFSLELTDSGEIIFDKKKYDELAYSIKKQRTENNLVELISISEFQKKGCNIRKETSIISLIICSVLNDFPVNKIADNDFIDGKHMKAIYLTVSKLIDEFELEIATLLKIFTEEKIGHYIDYSKCLKYNVVLKDIQYNMKTLASSLKNISGINSDLCYRFEKISTCAVEK